MAIRSHEFSYDQIIEYSTKLFMEVWRRAYRQGNFHAEMDRVTIFLREVEKEMGKMSNIKSVKGLTWGTQEFTAVAKEAEQEVRDAEFEQVIDQICRMVNEQIVSREVYNRSREKVKESFDLNTEDGPDFLLRSI